VVRFSPKQSDVPWFYTINDKMGPVLSRSTIKWQNRNGVISMGAAPRGGFYRALPRDAGHDEIVPVYVYIPMPTDPEAVLDAISNFRSRSRPTRGFLRTAPRQTN
jgi:NADH:ubiquinone oxidoreductase subunit B-like Fe-S oxidoreductase